MFNFISFNKKYGGYISSFHLEKFWSKLSATEQELAKELFVKSKFPEVIDANIVDTKGVKVKPDCTKSEFLYNIGKKAYAAKEFHLGEVFLTEAVNFEADHEKKHEITNVLIDLFYKQRETKEDAIKKCIEYCWMDVKNFPKISASKDEVPSFKRLAIIFESEKKYNEAIKVSKLALKYGLSDGTKGGYEGRINKLQEKTAN
jgi:hypothetical protein